MTPLERYRHDLEQGGFESDPAQHAAARQFQHVYDALIADTQSHKEGLFGRLRRLNLRIPNRAGHRTLCLGWSGAW